MNMKTIIYFPFIFGLIWTTFAQDFTSFFSDIEIAVNVRLSSAEENELESAESVGIGVNVIDLVISALGYRALVEAEFENVDQINTDEIADDVVDILRDGLAEEQCDDLFANFDQILPEGVRRRRRRRLQDSVAEAASFFELLAGNVEWELMVNPLDLDEGIELALDERGFVAAVGIGLIALINADCDATELSILMTSARALALLRGDLSDGGGDDDDDDDLEDLLLLLALLNAGDSDDDDDSSDDDDGDDARTVNEAKDNLDLEEDELEPSDVMTLSIATSTMTNIWIALIVFCGFNMSLFWFFTARKKKQSVHYETAEEVPSVSVNH